MGNRDTSAVNLRSLDVLRGLLALYVVFNHARWLLWQGHANFFAQPHSGWAKALAYSSAVFKYGHLAVMVFFALSGFFIHLRMAQKLAQGDRTPRLGTGEYLRRRAWRLLPTYYFALLFTVVLDLFGRARYPMLYNAATPDAFTNTLFALKGYGWENVIPGLLLLPRSLGHYFGSNGPLWSLAFEMVYYLAYPAWFALRKRFGFRAYLIGIGLALGGAALRGQVHPAFVDWFVEVASLWAVWLTGAFLAEVLMRHTFGLRAIPISIAAASLAWVISHAKLWKPFELPLLMVIGASVVIIFLAVPQRMISFWFCRWFETLGQQSYTLYVCHFPIIALISAKCFQISGERPAHGWLALYGVTVAVVAGKACFHLCEAHFIHPRLHLEPKPTLAPAAGMAVVQVTTQSPSSDAKA
jgi:peptidoglycan/LPS O-acetylase OafA/YrhL